VKTTLKRGIGRAGHENGNGHAVFPPVVATPRTVYRQPPRRASRLRLVGRIVLWLCAVAAIVGSGTAGGAYLFLHEEVKELSADATTKEIREVADRLNVELPNQPAIALIVGYDQRMGADAEEHGIRSDTILLVRADPRERTLSMLSFPRDLYTDIHCPGRGTFRARINEAYSECGEKGTLETVRALTGLPIHYVVTVNFRGFKQIVAKLGGVWVDVDRRYFNDVSGPQGFATIDLKPGYQRLNGADSLDFVRFRHTDTDFHRIARQQLFLHAFKEAATTRISPTDVPRVVRLITENVEVAGAGDRISGKTMLRYALLAYHLPPGQFAQSRIENLREDSLFNLYADPAQVSAAVHQFTNPEITPVRQPGTRPVKPPPPAQTTVVVLNGNAVQGAAANGSHVLGQAGYRVLTVPAGFEANAPRMDYARTAVYFDPRQQRSEAAARRLARMIGDADVGRLPGRLSVLANGAMVVVVVGKTFTGQLAGPASQPARPPEPAQVVRNPDASRPLLQPLRGRVPFKLMVPATIEKSSRPDHVVPLRHYKVAKHHAVRLVFRTDANEYWGVQMTNWKDAPVLAQPNTVAMRDGRRYELHYSGRRLRMVALRDGETTYWVVNTLLNTLSNETMLAIARGLQPLPGD
jgi:LCP family protein required for cell wall assembly